MNNFFILLKYYELIRIETNNEPFELLFLIPLLDRFN